ncbi:MAG: hypothetical protein JO368_05050, partial [Acidimicrobiales bacterium]|nr:hypothetical protein [Acidimicrobiales bacterium]
VLSVAVEAVWSTGRWFGCALVAVAALDYLWLVPQVMQNLAWNAFFPIPFLIAGLALAWVVAVSRLGWWPVLVVVASVGAQCHLAFAPVMVLLVVAAPVLALADRGRPPRYRWLLWGAMVGLLCWIAPLVQELGANGNLTAVATNGGARQGLGFGLQAVARLGSLPPLWLHQEPTDFYAVYSAFLRTPAAVGVVVLVALAGIGVLAWARGRRALASLAFVALSACLGVLLAFASVPQDNRLNVVYIICLLWAVSIAVWSVGVWGAMALVAAWWRRRSPATADHRRPWPTIGAMVGVALVAVVGLVAALSYDPGGAEESSFAVDSVGISSTASMAGVVDRSVPSGPVAVYIGSLSHDTLASLNLTSGLAWRLAVAGHPVGLVSYLQPSTGETAPRSVTGFVFVVDHERLVAWASGHCTRVDVACFRSISSDFASRARR